MSYARFGWGGSNVYIFGTTLPTGHAIECCGCLLSASSKFFTDYGALLRHINNHREQGQYVPEDVVRRVMAEVRGDDPWIDNGTIPKEMVPNPPQPKEPSAIARIKRTIQEMEL